MAIFSLICMAILLVIVNVSVWKRTQYGVTGVFSFAGLAFSVLTICMGLSSPAVFLMALLLVIVSFLCARFEPRVGVFRALTFACMAAGVAAGVLISLPYVRYLRQRRAEYPFISVVDRLAYETKPAARRADDSPGAVARYSPPSKDARAWFNLAAAEDATSLNGAQIRTRSLAEIHASTVEQFVNSPGFGVGRMMYVNDRWLEPRKRSIIRNAPASQESAPGDPPGPLRVPLSYGPIENQTVRGLDAQLWNLHQGAREDFVSGESIGLFVDRDHVAGFEPHGFSDQFYANYRSPDEPDLSRVELVSLLKFESPRVYASTGKMPQMDELRDGPTRPLTGFETEALARLEKGEDLVYAEDRRRILALGSLRAIKQCTPCHSVERGALLGAFSYEFQSNRPAAPPGKHQQGRRQPLAPRRALVRM